MDDGWPVQKKKKKEMSNAPQGAHKFSVMPTARWSQPPELIATRS